MTGDLETRPNAGSAWFVIAIIAALSVAHAQRALHGRPTEWFTWTLLIMVASSAAQKLAIGTRWRSPIRLVFIVSAVATIAGVLFAFLQMA